MTITLSNLKPAAKSQKRRKRVGRGNASGHGTYSTRGLKGQRSRSGGKSGLKKLGLKMTLRRIPKKKGFTSRYPKYTAVNLKDLEANYEEGSTVDIPSLQKKGLVNRREKKYVKILGTGKINKKLTIKSHAFSESASSAIIQAGGKVLFVSKKLTPKRGSRKETKNKK